MASLVSKECKLVLVGKTGNGKSCLGNSLLCYTGGQNKPFKSETSSKSITKECHRQKAILNDGTLLTMVDTPGLFDTSSPNRDTIRELVKCIALCTPGPHVILFVVSIKRFTAEETNAVQILKKLFGTEAMKHIIFVFTGKDGLDGDDDDDATTLEDFVSNSPECLKDLLEEFQWRYVGIANKRKSPTHDSDVKDVMQLIYKTIDQNKNQVYSQEAFKEADTVLKEEIKKRQLSSSQTEDEIRDDVLNGLESEDKGMLYTLGSRLKVFITRAFQIPGAMIESAVSNIEKI